MDRGYVDFARLYGLHLALAFFVIRAKSNLQYRRLYSHPIDKATGLRCDQTIVLTGVKTARAYPIQVRRSSIPSFSLGVFKGSRTLPETHGVHAIAPRSAAWAVSSGAQAYWAAGRTTCSLGETESECGT
jgi:hypothetical protein